MREDVLLDRERILDLLESYENLLTAKQKEAVDAYYRYDLSLGEISEQTGTSRAAVNDAVKKTIAKLEDYEKKLGLLQKKEEWAKRKEEIDCLPTESRLASYQTLMEEIIHGI